MKSSWKIPVGAGLNDMAPSSAPSMNHRVRPKKLNSRSYGTLAGRVPAPWAEGPSGLASHATFSRPGLLSFSIILLPRF